jgi:glycosyl hydrolase family 106( putative alpha-L-rhamnosidase)
MRGHPHTRGIVPCLGGAPRGSRSSAARVVLVGLLVLGLAAVMLAVVVAGARASSDGKRAFAEVFADPPSSVRPLTYWWLPDPHVMTAEGVERDVEAMAEAGIGGVLPYREEFALPVDEHGRDLLRTALATAKRHEMTVDLSLGITFGIPERIGRPEVSEQELVYGTAFLDAGETFSGALPPPSVGGDDPPRPRSLVAVVAARCASSCETEKPVLLDEDSLVDVTDSVQDDKVEWTAPAGGGQWVLMSFWQRSALRSFGGGAPTSVVDRLSAAGARAVTGYLDEHTLTPEIRALLDDAGGVLHEDSIHLAGFHLWTQDFLSEFRKRRGYSLRKYLPVSIIANANNFGSDPVGMRRNTDAPADFDFAGDAGKRIRNDYFQTLSELWEQRYIATLQRWANKRGLEFRAQVAYGQTFSTSTAAHVDVPMTEAFQLADTLDGYRSMAGAVHMGGRNLFSVECCVTVTRILDDNYSTTWERMLSVIHNTFAGGANQVTIHGVTYPDAPGATWPGFNNFTNWLGAGRPGISEEFGPRMPYWQHMPDLMEFLSREQLVLRQGRPQVDVAMYRHSYWDYGFPLGSTPVFFGECDRPEGCELVNDHTVERAGYTYEFVGPALFDLPGAGVRDGRLIGTPVRDGRRSSQGPAYKALVLDSGLRSDVDGTSLAAGRQILGYARQGLPIVVVGQPADRTPFFGDRAQDPEVQRTIARLLELPNVRRVATKAEVPQALAELGVGQAARPEQPSNLLSFRRADGEANYYYLWNQNRLAPATGEPEPKPEALEQEISFEGRGQPFMLDAWTGEITPIATYQRDGDRITTRVSLAPGESTIIAIGPEGWQRNELGVKPAGLHATNTTADAVVFGAHDELRVRATSPGTYTTSLSDGRSVKSRIGKLPTSRTLSGWHLSVEDWQPGDTATETVKVPHELDLDSLRVWPEIPELKDASGIGRYTTQVKLGSEWTGADRGARIELGPIFDSVRLEVNGRSAGYVDPDNPVIDIGRHLENGTNEIEIEVATTLRNRLRTLLPVFENVDPQPYGLAGPVRLIPYSTEKIHT